MNVNADFSKRVVVHTDDIEWEASPMPGVDRRRLDRVAGENDRVTTVVRYAPGSQFSSHVHGGGEEFIVIEGIFEDDYGQWPTGSYIRNPPGSSHTPASTNGCTIFVKLWQFHPDDKTFIHANRFYLGAVDDAHRPGAAVSPLFKNDYETVRFETWAPNSTISLPTDGGAEVFVLEGQCQQAQDTLGKHSWIRVPGNLPLTFTTQHDGATVWVKSRHLSVDKI